MGHNIFMELGAAKRAGEGQLQPPAANGTIDLLGLDGATVIGNTASNQTWFLPDEADTLIATTVYVSNRSTGTLTIKNQATTTIDTVGTGETKGFVLTADETWTSLGGVSETTLASTAGAGMVGILDNAGYTTETNVEDALAELYGSLIGQGLGFVHLPLNCWRETTAMAVGAGGGLLTSGTTPVLGAVNGATNGTQLLTWAPGNTDEISQSVVLPDDINPGSNMTFHCRIASSDTNDAVGFSIATYINETEAAITDTTTTNQTIAFLEKTATLSAEDVGLLLAAGAHPIATFGLTPVAHATDSMKCTATWLTYTKLLLS
jgi:hypothetical protein